MLRSLYITLQFLFLFTQIQAQELKKLWVHEEILKCASLTMDAMYKWDFERADSLLIDYKELMPNHPSLPLFHAMDMYWKSTPFDYYDDDKMSEFFGYLDDCIDKCEVIIDKDKNDNEAVFFLLLARSLKARAYNYSGSTWKAVSEAKQVYSLTRYSIKHIQEFDEFNFSAGVYNYYREFYPESHPIYKPFLSFFPSGNKELGIEQLTTAMNYSIFTNAEAEKYLMWIYSHDNNLKATEIAYNIFDKYSNNEWYLFDALLVLSRFNLLNDSIAVSKINQLSNSNSDFYNCAGFLIDAIRLYQANEIENSFDKFKAVENEFPQLSTQQKYLEAPLYAYLYSIYKIKRDPVNSKKYYKLALNTTYGEMIIDAIEQSHQ
ncbi:hypothetical protein EI427_19185 [Flammeovirga pectinis]|uniref:Tetratricopeptide repeat protein n=2 Tax=Flammeovirga pectinis TaxID=2494373 RepID=A0A3S9P7U9_9BACT|nr:hypothetical protein EI427_19185 [Flammeovirga pectinis]